MTKPTLYLIIILLSVLACPTSNASNNAIDSLMSVLDDIVTNRNKYIDQKVACLIELRKCADSITGAQERFHALGTLKDEFLSFNTDSAYAISIEREKIAASLCDTTLLLNAHMDRAEILNAVAMYTETLDLLDSIPFNKLPEYLHPYYYHIKRTVYGRLADYAAFDADKRRYAAITNTYRDTLLMVNDPTSLAYAVIRADHLNANGKPQEAIKVLTEFRQNHELSIHDEAICAWTLSESYALLGDSHNRKRELLISSIADLKSAVREYISLRQLALLLYQEGDLDRAHRFMSLAVDDAAKCNARQRIVELNTFYPLINDIYVDKIQKQKRSLSWTTAIIALLMLILSALLLYTRKQMQEVAAAREKILNAYKELRQTNSKLRDANNSIAENSELKEVYIGRYMDQCLAYIDKHDSYRKTIGKLFGTGKTDELKKALKSSSVIDDELKAFYDQFDKTFLNLFPTFIEEFNSLLAPEEAIVPKKEGCLNTELRIFALIRLGITDSNQIAKFLRYSLTTIYNYRTRVRNKARGDRNLLEQEVAKIGRRRMPT